MARVPSRECRSTRRAEVGRGIRLRVPGAVLRAGRAPATGRHEASRPAGRRALPGPFRATGSGGVAQAAARRAMPTTGGGAQARRREDGCGRHRGEYSGRGRAGGPIIAYVHGRLGAANGLGVPRDCRRCSRSRSASSGGRFRAGRRRRMAPANRRARTRRRAASAGRAGRSGRIPEWALRSACRPRPPAGSCRASCPPPSEWTSRWNTRTCRRA